MGVIFESTGLRDPEKIKELLKQEGYDVYMWYDPPRTYYSWHTHKDYEVRWIVEGDIEIGTEENVFRLLVGDKIELSPNIPHWAKSEKGVKYVCGSKP